METENSVAIIINPPQQSEIIEDVNPPHPQIPIDEDNSNLSRNDFPKGFLFGVGTSAYQVEGGAATDCKGPSVWDDFTLRTPYRIPYGANGNVAADMYHRFKEDIKTMKKLGFDVYRFSISWSRILPGGRCSFGINRKGIDYYNDLIDTIFAHGMTPCVTLFHWDLPYCLEKEYDGFLSKKILPDFREYVELCFWEFGDRVKWWTTINEPWTYAVNGYVRGSYPPGKTSSDKSDPAKDVYTVGRNLLLAHAEAVQIYRTKFKAWQAGKIGIVLNSHWFVPLDKNSDLDKAAARRGVDFMLGWFLDPVLHGRYPQNMIDFVPAENLAPFTHDESAMLKGSTDYLGLNYYTTQYASNDLRDGGVGYDADQKVAYRQDKYGMPIGTPSALPWLYSVPWGLYEHLVYLKDTYKDLPPIYICENGTADKTDPELTAKEACVDTMRVKYHQDHLAYLLKAIKKMKVEVKGYFLWSWCDTFEWDVGYTVRFGIMYIDFINNQIRYPKDSALWFAKFLRGSKGPIEEHSENEPEKRLRSVEE